MLLTEEKTHASLQDLEEDESPQFAIALYTYHPSSRSSPPHSATRLPPCCRTIQLTSVLAWPPWFIPRVTTPSYLPNDLDEFPSPIHVSWSSSYQNQVLLCIFPQLPCFIKSLCVEFIVLSELVYPRYTHTCVYLPKLLWIVVQTHPNHHVDST